MKNNVFRLVSFAVLSITALGVLFVSLNKDLNKNIVENPYFTEDYYTVSEYNGKIAVFKNGNQVPADVFDVYVSSLPKHDRDLLENGIKAESTEDLQKIIEDYTG